MGNTRSAIPCWAPRLLGSREPGDPPAEVEGIACPLNIMKSQIDQRINEFVDNPMNKEWRTVFSLQLGKRVILNEPSHTTNGIYDNK